MLLIGKDLISTEPISSSQEISPSFPPIFNRRPEPKEPVVYEDRGKYTPRNSMNNLTGKEWIKFTRSWFKHNPPPRNKKNLEHFHPAKYPEDLIAKFIQFFTKEGMWVLDPFLGTGSTLVACDQTRRNGIGIELTEKWANIASKRTKQYVVQGDSRQLSQYHCPAFDFSISSPPYWDMLHHSRGGSNSAHKTRIKAGLDTVFSEDENDLGNIEDYNQFLSDLLLIYQEIYKVMRPGAYIAVIMQNLMKTKQRFYPLAWEFALKMREYQWQLCQEFLWCQRDKPLGIWGYPSTYISNVHHHYILIFRKRP